MVALSFGLRSGLRQLGEALRAGSLFTGLKAGASTLILCAVFDGALAGSIEAVPSGPRQLR
jgi:hypothetical protein